ncbi:unnamed protein product [Mytilus edulis]|uniref:Uncharacterized protein n=1 Tax=Mytilus edulis TaxID=6550 RepID=A0A8S3Q0E6_MYTED|nr:unnamed protein product [Mytilus edulis]
MTLQKLSSVTVKYHDIAKVVISNCEIPNHDISNVVAAGAPYIGDQKRTVEPVELTEYNKSTSDEFVKEVGNFYSRKMSNSANNTNNTIENSEVNQTNDKNNMADTNETYSSILQKQNTKTNYDVEDVKPVFILETDLFGNTKPSRDQFLTHIELYKTIDATICPASHLKGLQRVRGLWRIYFDSDIDREPLITSGITIRNKYIQVYSRNPRIMVNERPTYLKILRLKNVPCSAEDGQIERSLENHGCEVDSLYVARPAQMKRREDTTPLMAWAGFSHVGRQPLRGPACTDEEEEDTTTHGLGRVFTRRQPLRGPACTDEEEGGHHTTLKQTRRFSVQNYLFKYYSRQPLRGPPAQMKKEEDTTPLMARGGFSHVGRQPLRGPACTDEEEGGHHTTHGLGRVFTRRQPLRGPPAQMKRRRTPHHSWLGQGRQPLRGPACTDEEEGGHHTTHGLGRVFTRGYYSVITVFLQTLFIFDRQ